jgi:hypothetical protein
MWINVDLSRSLTDFKVGSGGLGITQKLPGFNREVFNSEYISYLRITKWQTTEQLLDGSQVVRFYSMI